ncbi:MAG TPA: anhydro-N-acetylmuramic acid kinase, partial [Gammaproteobacteria bacterium]|nr:anhydro-N-acetylmuramic acid kinase [Gammaproteobacteria bacterium]
LRVFGHATEPRCIVNIGGFSNVSILEKNQYRGFDTGPGNCLLDYWVKEHFDLDYDDAGNLAASGICNETLLNCCLADPYFARSTPKSTGREYFNPEWLRLKLVASGQKIAPVDVLATLLQLTALSISTEIKRYTSPMTRVFICGGGAHNLELLVQLSVSLEQTVQTTASLGIDPDNVEAALFAWLAKERLCNMPVDLCGITGSKRAVVLGGIYGI